MKSYTRDALVSAIKKCGIQDGDLVFMHSSLCSLGPPSPFPPSSALFCEFILEALYSVLGEKGTLCVPAYTTHLGASGKNFDPLTEASNYGTFPNFAIRDGRFLRSRHPLVSVAAMGPLREEICGGPHRHGMGAGSPFHRMLTRGVKTLFLGIDVKIAASFIHHAEVVFGAPYQYNKILSARTVENGVASETPSFLNVRYLGCDIDYDLGRLQQRLLDDGKIATANVGSGSIHCVLGNDIVNAAVCGMEEDYSFLLKQTPSFTYGRIPFDAPVSTS